MNVKRMNEISGGEMERERKEKRKYYETVQSYELEETFYFFYVRAVDLLIHK